MTGLIILIGILIGGIYYLRKKRQKERERDEIRFEAIRKFSSEIINITEKDSKLYKLAEMIKDAVPMEEDYKEFHSLTWGHLYNAVCTVLMNLLEELVIVLENEDLDLDYRRSIYKAYLEWKDAFFFEDEKKTEEKEIGGLD